MKKYKEIFKLKKMLDDAKVPYEFIDCWGYSKETIDKLKEIAPDIYEHYQICYPVFRTEDRYMSVVEGFGTYGAEKDLLEIMGGLTEKEEKADTVLGWLSAGEVFERIMKHYKGGK